MAPHRNPFQPEVPGTVPEQYGMPPPRDSAGFESVYGSARVNRRERSESRHRYAREAEEEEEERRRRSRSRQRHETEEEERRRSASRRRHEAERRHQDEMMELRRHNNLLTMDIDSLKDKVNNLNLASGSSAEDTERDSGMWSPTMSDRYSTPNSSPDRNRRPSGSLHRRKSSAARDMPRQRYYRDNRSKYSNERGTIEPAYSYQQRGYSRGRRPVEQLRRSQTYDDYPIPAPQQRRPSVRHIEQPRVLRHLTDYAHAYEDAEFDRGRGKGGVDYLRHEPRRGSRHFESEVVYDDRRGGGRRYYG